MKHLLGLGVLVLTVASDMRSPASPVCLGLARSRVRR